MSILTGAKNRDDSKSGYRTRLIPLILVTLTALTLLVVNYYATKILSASRGAVHGATKFAKGLKDASISLALYMDTKDPAYWKTFQEEMQVPRGYLIYRIALNNKDEKGMEKGIVMSKGIRKEWDDYLWLYQTFRNSAIMKKAVKQWDYGNGLTIKLTSLGNIIHHNLITNTLNNQKKISYGQQIMRLNQMFSREEEIYAGNYSGFNEKIISYLFMVNLIMALIIISSVAAIYRLMQLKDKIQEKDDIKSKFMSIASHELKTPITSMKASLQIINRITTKLNNAEQLSPFIFNANKQISRLADLVNNLLDITRIEAGQLKLDRKKFKLEDMIYDTVEQVFQANASHQISIEGNGAAEVYADKNRIEQVLINLLSNAIKYSPANNKIVVKLEKVDGEHKISVIDHGIGIPSPKAERIFDRFYRIHEISDQFQGLGLGLYISSEIVKRHGGKIGVQSKINQGSSFWFTIPPINSVEEYHPD